MDSKKLKKILAEANKLQAKADQKAQASLKLPKETPSYPKTPPDGEVWRVYKAICYKQLEFIVLLPCIFLPVAFIFYNGNVPIIKQMCLYYGVFCVGLPLSRYLYLQIRLMAKFAHFSKWRNRLPFVLAGWEKWVDAPNFHKQTHWRKKAIIQIFYTPNEAINTQTLPVILSLFCQKANDWFYFTDNPLDEEKWVNNTEQAQGSLNNRVVYTFYRFLEADLAPLVKQMGGITKIVLDVSKEEYERDFPSPSAD